MNTITVTCLEKDGRLSLPLARTADLSVYDEASLRKWTFATEPDTAGTSLRTLQKITTSPQSAAYRLDYALAYAETHLKGIRSSQGDIRAGTDLPTDRASLEALPTSVLMVYVARADGTEGMTAAEVDSLKKGSSADAAS